MIDFLTKGIMKWAMLLAFSIIFIACKNEPKKVVKNDGVVKKKTTNKVVLVSDIKWEALNPARGDKSPQAGTIWGDRKGTVPTGFLVKFVNGFSSPPHIHNVTYRGMVINAQIHNDVPTADTMWMSPGSFWTQPKGQAHITSAKGENSMAYIEIEQGPYLVMPAAEAFDDGERPVNVEQSNIVWTKASIRPEIENGPLVAYLWGKPSKKELYGALIKLPIGYKGKLRSKGQLFGGVVISGKLSYTLPNGKTSELDPGSYFTSEGESEHDIVCQQETQVYIRTNDVFDFINNLKK